MHECAGCKRSELRSARPMGRSTHPRNGRRCCSAPWRRRSTALCWGRPEYDAGPPAPTSRLAAGQWLLRASGRGFDQTLVDKAVEAGEPIVADRVAFEKRVVL